MVSKKVNPNRHVNVLYKHLLVTRDGEKFVRVYTNDSGRYKSFIVEIGASHGINVGDVMSTSEVQEYYNPKLPAMLTPIMSQEEGGIWEFHDDEDLMVQANAIARIIQGQSGAVGTPKVYHLFIYESPKGVNISVYAEGKGKSKSHCKYDLVEGEFGSPTFKLRSGSLPIMRNADEIGDCVYNLCGCALMWCEANEISINVVQDEVACVQIIADKS